MARKIRHRAPPGLKTGHRLSGARPKSKKMDSHFSKSILSGKGSKVKLKYIIYHKFIHSEKSEVYIANFYTTAMLWLLYQLSICSFIHTNIHKIPLLPCVALCENKILELQHVQISLTKIFAWSIPA